MMAISFDLSVKAPVEPNGGMTLPAHAGRSHLASRNADRLNDRRQRGTTIHDLAGRRDPRGRSSQLSTRSALRKPASVAWPYHEPSSGLKRGGPEDQHVSTRLDGRDQVSYSVLANT